MTISPEALRQSLMDRMFTGSVVENRWRGDLVEEIVSGVIAKSGWNHCSKDWNSWDFAENDIGLKLQVKQAACRQTWSVTPRAAIRFGTKKSKGYYLGNQWNALPEPARIAELYLFAWHPDESEAANHWDATAWRFYGVREIDLPSKQSISLVELEQKLARKGFGPKRIDELAVSLASLTEGTTPNGRTTSALIVDPDIGDAEAPGEVE